MVAVIQIRQFPNFLNNFWTGGSSQNWSTQKWRENFQLSDGERSIYFHKKQSHGLVSKESFLLFWWRACLLKIMEYYLWTLPMPSILKKTDRVFTIWKLKIFSSFLRWPISRTPPCSEVIKKIRKLSNLYQCYHYIKCRKYM